MDGTPPGVSIIDGPDGPDGPDGATADRTPTFSFSANEGGASFECRMDSGDFVAGSSPFVSDRLADGQHTLGVRATDRADNTGAVASRLFTVEMPAPVTGDDSYATDEDHKLTVDARSGVLANDTAPDGPPTAIQVSGPSPGTLALEPDGSFVYTPEADYHGPDAFTYKTSDGNKESGEATVGIEVRPVNDAPGAEDEAVAERGWPLKIEVLGNDDDLDGDRLTVSDVSDPEHGGATASEDGRLVRYVPDSGYTGPDSFTYTVSDGEGGRTPPRWTSPSGTPRGRASCG